MDRIANAYLDFAERQASGRKTMKMNDWAKKLDGFLRRSDREILAHAGKISHEVATAKAELEWVHGREHSILPTQVEKHFAEATRTLEALERPQGAATKRS